MVYRLWFKVATNILGINILYYKLISKRLIEASLEYKVVSN